MKTISIALTTYNGERFLDAQLRSILSQTHQPDELIAVDDGSNDTTLDILHDFANFAHFPVHIYKNTSRLGWRSNFMKAIGLCKSELISFCDQDDLWYPERLRIIEPLFADPDLLLVHHEADVIDESGNAFGLLRQGENDHEKTARLSKPTIWSHAPGLTIVFRRSLLAFNPYWPTSVDPGASDMPAAHDQWMYHLASNLGDIRFISEPMIGYRQHNANAIGFQSRHHHAWGRPSYLREEINIHTRMIEAFTDILERALIDGNTGFNAYLPAAISANRLLGKRLALRNSLYQSQYFIQRLEIFLRLLKIASYKRSTKWNLGRRSLLADFQTVFRSLQ